MEKHIPKGYKKTEVGVIPEDWVVTSLKKISVIKRGASPRPINSPRWFSNQGRGWVRISDVTKANTYLMNVSQHLSPIGEQNSVAVEASDLIMSICATVGVPIILGIPACIHDGFVLFKNYEQILEKMFFFYFLKNYSSSASSKGQSGTQKNLNTSIVGNILIPVPQKTEQKAIATALSDVDNLITSLEQLIEKKKAIKQGAMQELLTGRRRLPGFGEGKGYKQTELGLIPEDWRIDILSNIGAITTGGTPSTTNREYWNGDYPWITPTDINERKNISNSERAISEKGLLELHPIPKDSILVTCIASIGKNAILRKAGACNQQINALSPNINHDVDYLYYLFEISKNALISKAGQTATMIISKREFSLFKIIFPASKAEQAAIAEVLSNMDSEIENLETKVDKYKQIKQGMMQNLLTGRIRLV